MDEQGRLLATRAPGWSILIRLLVGPVVFLPEGIQKLAFSVPLRTQRAGHSADGLCDDRDGNELEPM
jgi:hypothetical protein